MAGRDGKTVVKAMAWVLDRIILELSRVQKGHDGCLLVSIVISIKSYAANLNVASISSHGT